MADLSITETPNALTQDIDIADSSRILHLLSQTDSEMFHGWNGYGGLYDPAFLRNIVKAAGFLTDMLFEAHEAGCEARMIFTGAGTSGRIAMLLADAFNAAFSEIVGYNPLDFCIAGGHGALIKAKEGAEDDPLAGIADLEKKCPESGLFICAGITCGFSANYIAGQMDWTVIQKKMPAFLIGFNPLERARSVKPENWHKSFADVLNDVSKHHSMILLNPIIGPEPVTGSTRMKGGSATKIIGETLLRLGLETLREKLENKGKYADSQYNFAERLKSAETLIQGYEQAVNLFYKSSSGIVSLLDRAGKTLNDRGRIVYLGEGIAGRLGIIDASECPPTYGAAFEDVRGFCPEGWKDFCRSCGSHSFTDQLYNISFSHFQKTILPGMSAKDTLIFSGTPSFYKIHLNLLNMCKHLQPFKIRVHSDLAEEIIPEADYVLENADDFALIPMLSGLQLKLLFNAVTTAAHIFKGKVYRNKMIDLRISNNKLYHRSIRIIEEICNVSAADAEEALLKSIYGTDTVSSSQRGAPVSHHVKTAADREKIVPAALILASGHVTLRDAVELVNREHIIRNIIKKL